MHEWANATAGDFALSEAQSNSDKISVLIQRVAELEKRVSTLEKQLEVKDV